MLIYKNFQMVEEPQRSQLRINIERIVGNLFSGGFPFGYNSAIIILTDLYVFYWYVSQSMLEDMNEPRIKVYTN